MFILFEIKTSVKYFINSYKDNSLPININNILNMKTAFSRMKQK